VVPRVFALLVWLLMTGLHAPEACAHASLVKAEPADGAVIAAAPSAMTLTFNEPVSPLLVRLLDPAGKEIAPLAVTADNAALTVSVPTALNRGTHALSWRVISADGHPVGGSLIFSIGAPSAQSAVAVQRAPTVPALLWTAKVAIYVGMFVGVGGALFRAWIADARARRSGASAMAALAIALIAVPFSVGLQGLDALDLPLTGLLRSDPWRSGLETSYGRTAIATAGALTAGLLSQATESVRWARGFALAGVLGIGIALALSGHASTAEPRVAGRTALVLHGVGLAFWIGSLLPLYASIRAHPAGARELKRFSRVIPLPVALVILSGGWLAVVQLARLDALWTTSYGQVLACKLAAVVILFGLAAVNRFLLVPRLGKPAGTAARAFAASLALELGLALGIMGLVALWRFTPPPRAVFMAAPMSIHIHAEKAMAEIELERGQGARLVVLDGEFRPLAVKEVVLVLANPAAGIEPMRRIATRAGESDWRIEQLRIPIAGRWQVQVEMLISDFEKLTIEDTVTLPRVP
jgi:copper transport protein